MVLIQDQTVVATVLTWFSPIECICGIFFRSSITVQRASAPEYSIFPAASIEAYI